MAPLEGQYTVLSQPHETARICTGKSSKRGKQLSIRTRDTYRVLYRFMYHFILIPLCFALSTSVYTLGHIQTLFCQ
jgi:hypothetical protein